MTGNSRHETTIVAGIRAAIGACQLSDGIKVTAIPSPLANQGY
jgi:hypothetical protein